MVLAVAAVLGTAAQLCGKPRTKFDWAVAGLAALFAGAKWGGLLGFTLAMGPKWEGLYVIPAILFAALAAIVIEVIIRRIPRRG